MDELIYYWTQSMSNINFTENTFSGYFEKMCYDLAIETKLNVVDGTNIGTKTTDSKVVMLEDLFSEQPDIKLDFNMYCLHIPSEDILKRHKYSWFASESTENVIKGRNLINQKFNNIFDIIV